MMISSAPASVAVTARTVLRTVILLATGTLAWTGAHGLSLRLADPHAHLHEHAIAHGDLAHGQQQLAELHSYLAPTAVGAALTLALACLLLRAVPRSSRQAVNTRLLALTAAGSAATFAVVETAEHAVTTHTAPPAVLLLLGATIHAMAGLAAAAVSHTIVDLTGHPAPTGVYPPATAEPPRPATPAPRTLHPQTLLAVLTGRAPPYTTATPQLSL